LNCCDGNDRSQAAPVLAAILDYSILIPIVPRRLIPLAHVYRGQRSSGAGDRKPSQCLVVEKRIVTPLRWQAVTCFGG
jgi:hypothetical protein